MHFVYMAAVPDGRSYTKTDVGLANELQWHRICRYVATVLPDGLDRLTTTPIGYAHVRRFFEARVIRNLDMMTALHETFMRCSVDLALRMGLMDPDGKGSHRHPAKNRTFIGDGTVVPPLFTASPGDIWVDEETGETGFVRFDPDAHLYRTGDGKKVIGSLWVNANVRSEHENERITLGFAPVLPERPEAAVFMDLLTELRPLLPGAQAYVYDMALDAATINRGYDLGLMPVVKVSLTSQGQPSSSKLERVTLKSPDGRTHERDLWTFNGAAGIVVTTPAGEAFVRFELTRVGVRPNRKTGEQRVYGTFRAPDVAAVPMSLRGATVMIRLNQTDSDRARSIGKGRVYNRVKYLRPFPEGSDTFIELFGLREDAESDNNLLKQSLWNKRSHSVGMGRQWVDMLGYRLNRNIRAAMAFEKRTGVDLYPEVTRHRPDAQEVIRSFYRAAQ